MLKEAIESIKIILEALLNIFQISKSKKLKDIELIKEIEQILADNISNRKWYVSEVFFEITKIRFSYNDICAFVKEDNINKILYYIKKYPRVYEYKDGEFKYTQRFNATFQKANSYVSTFTIWFFGFDLITIYFSYCIFRYICTSNPVFNIFISYYINVDSRTSGKRRSKRCRRNN